MLTVSSAARVTWINSPITPLGHRSGAAPVLARVSDPRGRAAPLPAQDETQQPRQHRACLPGRAHTGEGLSSTKGRVMSRGGWPFLTFGCPPAAVMVGLLGG